MGIVWKFFHNARFRNMAVWVAAPIIFSINFACADIAGTGYVHDLAQSYTGTPIPVVPAGIASTKYAMEFAESYGGRSACYSAKMSNNILTARIASVDFANSAFRRNIADYCYIDSDSLIMDIRANNDGRELLDISGYYNDITMYNGAAVDVSENAVKIDTPGYGRTSRYIDLSQYSSITVEVRFLALDPTKSGDIFESSINWNNQSGGFGCYYNLNSSVYRADMVHCNHNGTDVLNITVPINTGSSHTITKVLSSSAATNNHKLYWDGLLINQATSNRPLRNDYMFFGCRAGESCTPFLNYYSIRIYKRELTAVEICDNAWADYNAFGGAVPNC